MPETATGEARCRPAKGSTNDRKRIGPAERLEKPGALASVEDELATEPAHRINPFLHAQPRHHSRSRAY
jgi:hypothetical protein